MRSFFTVLVAAAALSLATAALAQEASAHEAAAGAASAADAASGNTFWFFPGGRPGAFFGAVIGAGLVVIGAARGIGRIGSSAVEAIARQPEAGGRIFTSMLLSAALIEGFTLFALVVTLMVVLFA